MYQLLPPQANLPHHRQLFDSILTVLIHIDILDRLGIKLSSWKQNSISMPVHKKRTIRAAARTSVPKRMAPLPPVVLVLLVIILLLIGYLISKVIFAESKDGKISACVAKNGDIRILTNSSDPRWKNNEKDDKETKDKRNKDGCRENETLMEWNIQGPPGPSSSSNGSLSNGSPLICPQCSIDERIGDKLVGRNFTDAYLAESTFIKVNLSNVNFTNAILDSVNFTNANLKGANFSGASLNEVVWGSTTCPDGSNSNDHSNTCVGHL